MVDSPLKNFCFTTIETVHDLDIQGVGMYLPIESVEI